MLPEAQGCLSSRNFAHEKTQLRTLGRMWPSGGDEVASFRSSLAMISETNHPNSWEKLPPCQGTPQVLQEWHWILIINHVLRGQNSLCYFSMDLFFIHSSSSSSSGFNWMAFPSQRGKFSPVFSPDFVGGPPKSPLSHQPVFDFLFWRLFSVFTMTWQHKWVPGIHWDPPLQIFPYINTEVWGLTCRTPPSLATVYLKYGLFSSLEMGQPVPLLT